MTNEQPPNPPLTRRQLRELRTTGATPIITPAGIPVPPPAPVPAPERAEVDEVQAPAEPEAPAQDDETSTTQSADDAGSAQWAPPSAPPAHEDVEEDTVAPLTRRRVRDRTGLTDPVGVASVPIADESPVFPPAGPSEHPISQAAAGLASTDATERGVVSPQLGAALLAGAVTETAERPSFDQLLSRSSAGSVGTGSALIVSDSQPNGIIAPVNATGEVLVTGSLALPDLFGSTGQMSGSEALDIDGAFADGELPQHSSPTPIAASAAISTVKTTAEIIKPPVPEKGSRLMLVLAITAGVLALALVGVLILAFVTGVFS